LKRLHPKIPSILETSENHLGPSLDAQKLPFPAKLLKHCLRSGSSVRARIAVQEYHAA
jgi:hypothetical protein